ncbi:hypothetical protein [Kitasatospora sp. NPDC001175]|uniref:hypothetical protein n=1 Tax=Kitasatospora sp. NPDC001175 TaxID=3157103 RepID=UPI003CFDDA26
MKPNVNLPHWRWTAPAALLAILGATVCASYASTAAYDWRSLPRLICESQPAPPVLVQAAAWTSPLLGTLAVICIQMLLRTASRVQRPVRPWLVASLTVVFAISLLGVALDVVTLNQLVPDFQTRPGSTLGCGS